jgi:hypothetical protein
MRLLTVGLALLAVTGCTADAVDIAHSSQVETRARGLALLDTSDAAQVGMSGNTCEVQLSTGAIGADTDVAPGEEDNVQDAVGSSTIIVGTAGAYVHDQGSWEVNGPSVRQTGVTQARFTDSLDVVALNTNAGEVSWNGADPVAVPSGSTGLAVDRFTGTAFVVDGLGLTVAERGGEATTTPGDFDLVAYDPAAEVVYVAELGGSEIRALEVDGAQRWAADLGGSITSIDDMGAMGAVVVMLEIDGGFGELIMLDGVTGEQLSSTDTPSAADEVRAGNNGESLAVVLPNEVHFFSVAALR